LCVCRTKKRRRVEDLVVGALTKKLDELGKLAARAQAPFNVLDKLIEHSPYRHLDLWGRQMEGASKIGKSLAALSVIENALNTRAQWSLPPPSEPLAAPLYQDNRNCHRGQHDRSGSRFRAVPPCPLVECANFWHGCVVGSPYGRVFRSLGALASIGRPRGLVLQPVHTFGMVRARISPQSARRGGRSIRCHPPT